MINGETGFTPEMKLSALPQNPAEYSGDFVSPAESKRKDYSAGELLRIYDSVEELGK